MTDTRGPVLGYMQHITNACHGDEDEFEAEGRRDEPFLLNILGTPQRKHAAFN